VKVLENLNCCKPSNPFITVNKAVIFSKVDEKVGSQDQSPVFIAFNAICGSVDGRTDTTVYAFDVRSALR